MGIGIFKTKTLIADTENLIKPYVVIEVHRFKPKGKRYTVKVFSGWWPNRQISSFQPGKPACVVGASKDAVKDVIANARDYFNVDFKAA